METLFNIGWAVLGTIGVAAGLWLRRRFAQGPRRELARDVVLLCAIVFLLFPIISFSDDIGYFNYYFSRGQAPDALFWVSGARREEHLPSPVVLHVFALLLAAIVTAHRRRTILGAMVLPAPAPLIEQPAAPLCLRAPPLSLF